MEGRERLEALIERERAALLKTLRYYVFRAGLASGRDADEVAEELLHEVAFEAFRSIHRLTPEMHPKPWLLGIAVNLIKRKQVDIAKRERREPLMRDLLPQIEAALSDEELFDQLPIPMDGLLDNLEVKEEIDRILARVPSSDGNVIRLAFFYDMNRDELAQALNVSPSAARMRLHRALSRLRSALEEEGGYGNV
jgi:RNA polymerase sigma-70 factor (ECF subfamily)